MATEDANGVTTTATSLGTMAASLVTPTTTSVTVSISEDSPNDDLTTVSASITQAKLLQTAEAKIQDTDTANVSGKRTRKRRRANKRTNTDEATRNICIRFEGNQSKRWDGKEVLVDYEWVKEKVDATQLLPRSTVNIPWPIKGGEIQN